MKGNTIIFRKYVTYGIISFITENVVHRLTDKSLLFSVPPSFRNLYMISNVSEMILKYHQMMHTLLSMNH